MVASPYGDIQTLPTCCKTEDCIPQLAGILCLLSCDHVQRELTPFCPVDFQAAEILSKFEVVDIQNWKGPGMSGCKKEKP